MVQLNSLSFGLISRNWSKDERENALKNKPAVASCACPIFAGFCRVRFVDEDLNRQFALPRLREAPDGKIWEQTRAAELDQILGPKANEEEAVDFVLDLHTTTANMGVTLVAHLHDPVSVAACAFAADRCLELYDIEAKILLEEESRETSPFLFSVGRHGVLVEVGAISTGLVEANVVRQMRLASECLLEFFERTNEHAKAWSGVDSTPEVRFDGIPGLSYPAATWPAGERHIFMDSGRKVSPPASSATEGLLSLPAMYHPEFQGKDWSVLRPGQPLFQTAAGENILYDGSEGEGAVAIFVNEAGYQNASSGAGFGIAYGAQSQVLKVVADPATL
jgi:aspartoacylase